VSTLLQDIPNPSQRLLNVFLQIANKFGIKKKYFPSPIKEASFGLSV
jgi:hypothetical protein